MMSIHKVVRLDCSLTIISLVYRWIAQAVVINLIFIIHEYKELRSWLVNLEYGESFQTSWGRVEPSSDKLKQAGMFFYQT